MLLRAQQIQWLPYMHEGRCWDMATGLEYKAITHAWVQLQ